MKDIIGILMFFFGWIVEGSSIKLVMLGATQEVALGAVVAGMVLIVTSIILINR